MCSDIIMDIFVNKYYLFWTWLTTLFILDLTDNLKFIDLYMHNKWHN
jgi:hypothetical protein